MQYPRKDRVLLELFGGRVTTAVVDLPQHLDTFIIMLSSTQRWSVEHLITEHTLLPWYAAFLPAERRDTLYTTMRTGTGSWVHVYTGLICSSVSLPLVLRYCPLCVEQDRRLSGETYWHRVHQLAGIVVCAHHHVRLHNSSVPTYHAQTRCEFVSAESAVPTIQPRDDVCDAWYEILRNLADDAAWLLRHHHLNLDLHTTQQRYMVALAAAGLATYQGRVYAKKLAQTCLDHYSPELLSFLHGPRGSTSVQSWLLRLVRSQARVQHPLQHLLLIRLLGYSAEEFFKLPTDHAPFGTGPWPCLNAVCPQYEQLVIENCTITYRLDTQRRPLGTFACACGFVYSRTGPDATAHDCFRVGQVKCLGPLWESKLQEWWMDHTVSLKQMSLMLGVETHTAKYYAVRLGLPFPPPGSQATQPVAVAQQRYPQALTQSEAQQYQEMLLTALQENPLISATALRRKMPAVYDWLYQHKRAWMQAHVPKRRRASLTQVVPHVDWQSRDVEYTAAVRREAERIRNDKGVPVRITGLGICRRMGRGRFTKYELQKLPQTTQALQKVVETTEAFMVRRIEYATKQYLQEQVLPKRWQLIKRIRIHAHTALPEVAQALDEALMKLATMLECV